MKGYLKAASSGRVICRRPVVVWHGKINSNAHRPAVYGGTNVFEDCDTAEVRAGELIPHHFEGLDGLVLEPSEPTIRLKCRKKVYWQPPGEAAVRTFYGGQVVDVPAGTEYPDAFRVVG